jgi:hypothetical protein
MEYGGGGGGSSIHGPPGIIQVLQAWFWNVGFWWWWWSSSSSWSILRIPVG